MNREKKKRGLRYRWFSWKYFPELVPSTEEIDVVIPRMSILWHLRSRIFLLFVKLTALYLLMKILSLGFPP